MWISLGIVAAISLILLWRGPNAAWGGLPVGALVGVAVGLFASAPFSWFTVGKGAIVGVLVGASLEFTRFLGRRRRAPVDGPPSN